MGICVAESTERRKGCEKNERNMKMEKRREGEREGNNVIPESTEIYLYTYENSMSSVN